MGLPFNTKPIKIALLSGRSMTGKLGLCWGVEAKETMEIGMCLFDIEFTGQ